VDQQNNPSARNRFLASIVEIGRASRFSNHALSEIGRICLFVMVGERFAGTASAAPLDTACLRKCVAGVTHAVMIAVNAEHKLSDLPSRQAGILRDDFLYIVGQHGVCAVARTTGNRKCNLSHVNSHNENAIFRLFNAGSVLFRGRVRRKEKPGERGAGLVKCVMSINVVRVADRCDRPQGGGVEIGRGSRLSFVGSNQSDQRAYQAG